MKLKFLLILIFFFFSCRNIKETPASSFAKLGTKAFKLKLYKEAEIRFLQALKKEPKNAKYLNNLGIINEILGNFEEAKKYYEEAIKLEPKNKKIKENYERFEKYIKNNPPSLEL